MKIILSKIDHPKYTLELSDFLLSNDKEEVNNLELFLIFDNQAELNDFRERSVDLNNLRIIKSYRSLPILYVNSNLKMLEKITQDERIEKVDINFRCYLSNDSTTTPIPDNMTDKFRLRTKKTIGQGIRIAIVDSGIDRQHPNLKNPIIMKIDIKNELWDDLAGHGTTMAGVISKIAPKAELIDVKITSRTGLIFASDILSGLDELFSTYIDIVVFGVTSPIHSNGSDVLSQFCRKYVEKGVQLVFPAGNFGPEENTIGFPDHVPNSFCIGSVNSSGRTSFFSSRSSEKPDFYVGGENVTTLKSFHGILGHPLPNYPGKTLVSGTSIAAAKFVGILVFVKHAFPEYSYKELKDFFTQLNPTSKLVSEKIVVEKVNILRPMIFPFKKSVVLSSLITLFLGILGITSILLAK